MVLSCEGRAKGRDICWLRRTEEMKSMGWSGIASGLELREAGPLSSKSSDDYGGQGHRSMDWRGSPSGPDRQVARA